MQYTALAAVYLIAVEKSVKRVSRQEVFVVLICLSLGTPNILFSYITFLKMIT